jgi:hypothetical protein
MINIQISAVDDARDFLNAAVVLRRLTGSFRNASRRGDAGDLAAHYTGEGTCDLPEKQRL